MKLASLKGGRDGRLVVVSRDLSRYADAGHIAATMQAALDNWAETLEQWRRLGATHATFYTSGQGVGGLDEQIAAMRSFLEHAR